MFTGVAYRTVDSPFEPLLLAATAEGVVRVAFEREDHGAVLGTLAERVSPRFEHAPGRLDETARQLEQYFAGSRRTFDLPVDLRLARGFRRTVLDHLRSIPYGATESYSVVAAASGSPAAMRAVGTACATNPLPLVVPCHRVVRSDGTFGQYLGGVETKRALLALEAARPEELPGAGPDQQQQRGVVLEAALLVVEHAVAQPAQDLRMQLAGSGDLPPQIPGFFVEALGAHVPHAPPRHPGRQHTRRRRLDFAARPGGVVAAGHGCAGDR